MTELETLENSLKEVKEDLSNYDLYKELMDNEAFKKLILDGFIKEKSLNASNILEHESTKDKDLRRVYKHQRISSSVLNNYLESLRILGRDAEEGQQYIEEMIEKAKYGEVVSDE